MKTNLFTLILTLNVAVSVSQNLIPNGDFEQYSSCPSSYSQLDSALFWINPTTGSPNGSTPDYFNQCATSPSANVPGNLQGFQFAHSGVAYAGIYTYSAYNVNGDKYREYTEAPIVTPLIANGCYHFEMYVNLGNKSQFNSADFGVYFSDTLIININNPLPLPYVPQLNNSSLNLPDTINWTLFSGDYIAAGGENYLIIGNFKNDSNTVTTPNNSGGLPYTYIYIDGVSLTPCVTGIEESDHNDGVQIFPNPFSKYLTIENKSKIESELILYDGNMKEVKRVSFVSDTQIDTQNLSKGMYFYSIRNNKNLKHGKLVKVK